LAAWLLVSSSFPSGPSRAVRLLGATPLCPRPLRHPLPLQPCCRHRDLVPSQVVAKEILVNPHVPTAAAGFCSCVWAGECCACVLLLAFLFCYVKPRIPRHLPPVRLRDRLVDRTGSMVPPRVAACSLCAKEYSSAWVRRLRGLSAGRQRARSFR